jgi:MFS family permease
MSGAYDEKNSLNRSLVDQTQLFLDDRPPTQTQQTQHSIREKSKRRRALSNERHAAAAAAAAASNAAVSTKSNEATKHKTDSVIDLSDAVRRASNLLPVDGVTYGSRRNLDDNNDDNDDNNDDDDFRSPVAGNDQLSLLRNARPSDLQQRGRDPSLIVFPPKRELVASSGCCYIPRRLIVLCMTALALCLAAFYREILADTVHAIKDSKGWTDDEETLIDDSYVWGFVCSVMVGGIVSHRHGFKAVLAVGVVVNALSTMLAPFALASLPWLIVCRTIAGAAEGVVLPSAYVMMSKWTPLTERARSVSLIWGASYLGAAVGSVWQLIILQVEQELGWALVYIGMGVAGVIWFAVWLYIVAERPEDHKTMAQRERRFILDSVPRPKPGHDQFRPAQGLTWLEWARVVVNWPVIAIVVSHIAYSLSIFVFLDTAPKFLRQYNLYPVGNDWLWSGLPVLLMFVVCVCGGCVADMLVQRRWHPTVVRQVFQLGGTIMPTLLGILLALTYLTPTIMTSMTICAAALLGLQVSGFATDVLDVSPAFAGIVMAVTLVGASLPQVGSAFLMPYLLAKFHSWSVPFILAGAVNLLSALLWSLCSSGRRAVSDHAGGSFLKM